MLVKKDWLLCFVCFFVCFNQVLPSARWKGVLILLRKMFRSRCVGNFSKNPMKISDMVHVLVLSSRPS